MNCTNKFTLNKQTSNIFSITIKQDSSALPMTIEPTDTFVTRLFKRADNSEVIVPINTSVSDAANGKIEINFTDVSSLTPDRGPKVDDYYLKANYKITIEASTANNGDFTASIPYVYVD